MFPLCLSIAVTAELCRDNLDADAGASGKLARDPGLCCARFGSSDKESSFDTKCTKLREPGGAKEITAASPTMSSIGFAGSAALQGRIRGRRRGLSRQPWMRRIGNAVAIRGTPWKPRKIHL